MAGRVLITFGTDDIRDWVHLPNGRMITLGSTSVLKFVAELAQDKRSARKALDRFLETKEAMLSVNLEALEKLLAPKRARWATDKTAKALISNGDRTSLLSKNKTVMEANLTANAEDPKFKAAFISVAAEIEQQLSVMKGDGSSVEALKAKIAKLQEPLGQKIAASYTCPKCGGSGHLDNKNKDCDECAGTGKLLERDHYLEVKKEVEKYNKKHASTTYARMASAPAPTASSVALDVNSKLAETIMGKIDASNDGVDRLVKAGRRFNASKAKGDLHGLSAKLANLLQNADLAQPWVKDELNGLAKQADVMHGYFGSVK